MKIENMNYQSVTELIYEFVCNNKQPFYFEWQGKTWEVFSFGDGSDGASHHGVFTREENGWVYYSEYHYSRETKEIIGIRTEQWKNRSWD